MSNEQFFREAFSLPPTLIEYHVSQSMKHLFPEKACIEVDGGYFDVESYANAQHCLLAPKTFIHNQVMTHWIEPGPEVMLHPGHSPRVRLHAGAQLHTHRSPQSEEAGKPEDETMDRFQNAWLEVQWQEATLSLHQISARYPARL